MKSHILFIHHTIPHNNFKDSDQSPDEFPTEMPKGVDLKPTSWGPLDSQDGANDILYIA